ncbi:hypothetical protein GCM10027578_02400 [Spirosoma luteolum]
MVLVTDDATALSRAAASVSLASIDDLEQAFSVNTSAAILQRARIVFMDNGLILLTDSYADCGGTCPQAAYR